MPKQKTKKSARKRFHFSSQGKVKRLHTYRSHFNAKDSGNYTRRKHQRRNLDASDSKRVTDLLPYQ